MLSVARSNVGLCCVVGGWSSWNWSAQGTQNDFQPFVVVAKDSLWVHVTRDV